MNVCGSLNADQSSQQSNSSTISKGSQNRPNEITYQCAYDLSKNWRRFSWTQRGIIVLQPGVEVQLFDLKSGKLVGSSRTDDAFLCSDEPVKVGEMTCNIEEIEGEAVNLILMDRPDQDHQRKYNKDQLRVVDVHINPKLAKFLRDYQIEGVKFIYKGVMGMQKLLDVHAALSGREGRLNNIFDSAGVILADEMGLGKTLQIITVIDMLLNQSCYQPHEGAQRGAIERVLILCPASLKRNWGCEFEKWLNNDFRIKTICKNSDMNKLEDFLNEGYKIVIVNYDKIRSHVYDIKTLRKKFDLLVCDEAQVAKNEQSRLRDSLSKLGIKRTILMTGTPIQNTLDDFHSLVDLVVPEYLGDLYWYQKTFTEPIKESRKSYASSESKTLAREKLSILREVAAPLIIARQAAEINLNLPEKHNFVIFCNPSPLQRRIYHALAAGNKDTGKGILKTLKAAERHPIEGIHLLNKLCSTPDLLVRDLQMPVSKDPNKKTKGETAKKVFKHIGGSVLPKDVMGYPSDSGKLCFLMKLLRKIRKNTDDKVVLSSHFKGMLDIFEDIFKSEGFFYSRFDGDADPDERMEIVKEFNRTSADQKFILLLTVRTGGVGFNLIGANHLIVYDGDWNPAIDLQVMARILREGQKKDCYIYQLVLAGTIDEKILQRQNSKLGIIEKMSATSEFLADDHCEYKLRDTFAYQCDTINTNGKLIKVCGQSLEPMVTWDHYLVCKSRTEIPEHFKFVKNIIDESSHAENVSYVPIRPSWMDAGEIHVVLYKGIGGVSGKRVEIEQN